MLRDRFRQWGVNTKNAKAKRKTESNIALYQPANATRVCHSLRPVDTSLEDVPKHRLLSTVDHWFGEACSRHASGQDWDGYHLPDILYGLEDAIYAASRSNDSVAWHFLQNFGNEICQANWKQLLPSGILPLVYMLSRWQYSDDNATTRIHLLLSNLVSKELGERHPVAVVIRSALHRDFSIGFCHQMAALIDSKVEGNGMSITDRQTVQLRSRMVLAQAFARSGQFQMMENTLNQFTPSEAKDKAHLWLWLAHAKHYQKDYEEACRLYSLSRDAYVATGAFDEFAIEEGHSRALLQLEQTAEAAKVVLGSLSRWEAGAQHRKVPLSEKLSLRAFACSIEEFCEELEHREMFDSVLEKLNELKFR